MFIRVNQQIVYLLWRQKPQLAQLLFGRMIEVNGRLVQGVQIRLQLLVVHLAKFCYSVVNIEDDVVQTDVGNE